MGSWLGSSHLLKSEEKVPYEPIGSRINSYKTPKDCKGNVHNMNLP